MTPRRAFRSRPMGGCASSPTRAAVELPKPLDILNPQPQMVPQPLSPTDSGPSHAREAESFVVERSSGKPPSVPLSLREQVITMIGEFQEHEGGDGRLHQGDLHKALVSLGFVSASKAGKRSHGSHSACTRHCSCALFSSLWRVDCVWCRRGANPQNHGLLHTRRRGREPRARGVRAARGGARRIQHARHCPNRPH